MIFNLKAVTRHYVNGYFDFLKKNKLLDEQKEDLFDLFSYCLKHIYGLPSSENNYFIDMYSEGCIKHLKKLKGVPKKVDKITVSERVSIVTMCNNYYLAVQLKAEGLMLSECKE